MKIDKTTLNLLICCITDISAVIFIYSSSDLRYMNVLLKEMRTNDTFYFLPRIYILLL